MPPSMIFRSGKAPSRGRLKIGLDGMAYGADIRGMREHGMSDEKRVGTSEAPQAHIMNLADAFAEAMKPKPTPKVEIHNGTVRGWPLYVAVGERVVADIPGDSVEDARPTAERIAAAFAAPEEGERYAGPDARWLPDDPEMDCTDGAHPAWWRGQDYGAEAICREVSKILDGTHDVSGTASEPWEAVRRRLLGLVRSLPLPTVEGGVGLDDAAVRRIVRDWWGDAELNRFTDSRDGHDGEDRQSDAIDLLVIALRSALSAVSGAK